MTCSKCGNHSDESERFCRKCGAELQNAAPVQNLQQSKNAGESLAQAPAKDPDVLMGNGVGSFFVGDGFLVVGIILSATNTSISSLLWLLLLIPAFVCYGKGISDVVQARQIRRRLQQKELAATTTAQFPPPRGSVTDVFKGHSSGELFTSPSLTEKTTRRLE